MPPEPPGRRRAFRRPARPSLTTRRSSRGCSPTLRGRREIWLDNRAYHGDFAIKRSLSLFGSGQSVLEGTGTGTVVTVDADDVTLENFTCATRASETPRRTPASRPRASASSCGRLRTEDTLFGVQLLEPARTASSSARTSRGLRVTSSAATASSSGSRTTRGAPVARRARARPRGLVLAPRVLEDVVRQEAATARTSCTRTTPSCVAAASSRTRSASS